MSVDNLETRVNQLAEALPAFARELQLAFRYIQEDPQSSVTKSRQVLAKLLFRLYSAEMGREPREPLAGAMLGDGQFTGRIEPRILYRMNAIREIGDLGSHGAAVEPSDAARVLEDLCEVLDWYLWRTPGPPRPAPPRRAPCPSPGPGPDAVAPEDADRTEEAPMLAVPMDQVQFSVTAPASLTPGSSCVLDVWAHLEDQRREVLARAREALGGQEVRIRSKGVVLVAEGTLLTVHLSLPGFTVGEPEDFILWEGTIGNASFPVRVPPDREPGHYPGTVHVFAGALQIARVHFTVAVGPREAPADVLVAEVYRVRTAFASYASPDRDAVLARVQGIQKALPGLDVFLDVAALRSGQRWRDRLYAEVTGRDVFFLFWSAHARQSRWVDWEWRTALAARGIDYIDPVPLASPEEAPPPKELAEHLHFNDWVLAFRRGQRATEALPPKRRRRDTNTFRARRGVWRALTGFVRRIFGSVFGALVHGLWAGVLGSLLGLVFACLCFWVTIASFLYFDKPVSAEDAAPRLLPLPVAARQIDPPPGSKADKDYPLKCLAAVWQAVTDGAVGRALLGWFALGCLFGVPVSVCCQFARLLLSPAWGRFPEAASVLLLFGTTAALYLRPAADEQVRLGFYGALLGLNLLWMSLTGFRLRALAYALAAVLAGELRGVAFPLAVIPATALWLGFLFVFFHASFAAFALEYAEK
jgi:hypothetical protein